MPGVRVFLAKRDVKDAFRWVPMHESDVRIFGADLDGKHWGIPGRLVAIYLVLTFGWTGSPGEWMIWAWMCKSLHASRRPADERWDDSVGFHSHFLMDDMVLVEPDLGTRPEQSGAAATGAITKLLGPAAVNAEKDLEEGAMEVEKICWGLLYNTDKETIRMPPPKVEKALHMLADPNLDYGRRDIDYKFLEQYRGNQQYWTIVMPAMMCTLNAADALLKGGR